MFAERDKHYPSRSRQTSLATAVTKITKPVTKNNFGLSIQGRAEKILLSSVTHVPSGLMGCALAA